MRSSHRRRSVLVAALIALGSFGMASQPQPAIASTLTVTYLSCEVSTGGNGYYSPFFCDGYVSGGSGGNTFTWSVGTNTRWDSADASTITSTCRVNRYQTVTFSVRDSSGATASAQTMFYCYAIAP